MSTFSRITGIFLSPVKTMKDIAAAPTWVVPILLGTIVWVASTAIILPRVDWETIIAQQVEKQGRTISEADLQQAVTISKPFYSMIYYVFAAVGALCLALITALVLFAIIRLGGGETTYRKLFAAVSWAGLIKSLQGLILIVPLMGLETFDPNAMATLIPSNPAFLVDRESVGGFVYALLSAVDVFTIWWLVVMIIGVMATSSWSRGKSAAAVLIPFGLLTVGGALLTALFT